MNYEYAKIRIKSETERCLVCENAACGKACPVGIPADEILRALRFDDPYRAREAYTDTGACLACPAPCMQACRRGRIDRAVDIPGVLGDLKGLHLPFFEGEADLSVDFMGVHCENPFFLSSSVIGSNYEMVAKAFEAGWAGVAFKTIGLFVPEELSPRFGATRSAGRSFEGFKNLEQISDHTAEENFGFLKKLKEDYPAKIIISSIMGENEEEWTELARLSEEAGADIIECNFSCPQMVGDGLGCDVGTDPALVAKYTAAVKRGSKLPVLIKMTPNITNMELPARAGIRAGADGIAAINTVKSVMNIDLDDFSSAPSVQGKSAVGGYSGRAVRPIALRFIQDLKKDPLLSDVPVSGMGGIYTWRDAAEFIALGCGTVQVTTAVMEYGYRIIDDLKAGLSHYLVSKNMDSVEELIGAALPQVVPAEDLDRQTIEFPKFLRARCVGCGRCVVSCYDGGHQALAMDPKKEQPVLNGAKCVGCQLCVLVCPAEAIKPGARRLKKT